jgi:hypothetical protein
MRASAADEVTWLNGLDDSVSNPVEGDFPVLEAPVAEPVEMSEGEAGWPVVLADVETELDWVWPAPLVLDELPT